MYEFDYKLRHLDLIKFQLARIFFNVKMHLFFSIISLIVNSDIWFKTHDFKKFPIAFIGAYFMIALFTFIFMIPFLFLKKDNVLLAKTNLKIDKESVYAQSKFGDLTIFWNNNQKIKETFGNVLFYTSPNSLMLIPKSAFKSDQQRLEFVEFCKQNIKNSKLP